MLLSILCLWYVSTMTVFCLSSWGSKCNEFFSCWVDMRSTCNEWVTWCLQGFNSAAVRWEPLVRASHLYICLVSLIQLNKVSIQGILENIFWYFLASLGALWDNSEQCLGWHFPETINKWRQTSHMLFFTLAKRLSRWDYRLEYYLDLYWSVLF